jgi:hypothetical protein
MVEKKLRRNLAAINAGRVGASAVKTAEQQMRNAVTRKVILRPHTSFTQTNRAPAIWPMLKIEKTRPVADAPLVL